MRPDKTLKIIEPATRFWHWPKERCPLQRSPADIRLATLSHFAAVWSYRSKTALGIHAQVHAVWSYRFKTALRIHAYVHAGMTR
eukprot:gene25056-biopygen16473